MKDRVNFLRCIQSGLEFKTHTRQIILVFGVLIALVIGLRYVFLTYQVGKEKEKISHLRVQLDNLNELQSLHQILTNKKNDLLKEKKRIHDMLELRFQQEIKKHAWSFLLKDLVSCLPPGVWFNRLSINSGPDSVHEEEFTIRLTGRTFSQEELMDFLSHLEKSPFWESATLLRVEREPNLRKDLPDLFQFEITMGLAV